MSKLVEAYRASGHYVSSAGAEQCRLRPWKDDRFVEGSPPTVSEFALDYCEFEVISDAGQAVHHRSRITLSAERGRRRIREQIDLQLVTHNGEDRLRLDSRGIRWEASMPRFERVQP